MSEQMPKRPSLSPSTPPASKDTSRVMPNVRSPAPHLGWYSRGYLPHWDHPGMIQSLSFRLGDSMPASVVEAWQRELALQPERYRATRRRDASAPRVELRRRIEDYLDAGQGECLLREARTARLVEE